MKTFTKCCAAILLAGSLISVAGCGGAAPDARVATTANWNPRTSAKVESNFYADWQTHKEVAEYELKLTKGTNSSYEIVYNTDTAVYKTEFYMEKEYDWKSSSVPEGYRSTAEGDDKEPVYVYRETRSVSVTYNIKGTGESKTFDDVLETVCKYRVAGKNLQPVYSQQTVKNTAPQTINAGGISDAVVTTDSVYTVYYNRDCKRATVDRTDVKESGTESETKEIDVTTSAGYSVFDNCQLSAAIRAFTLSGGASRVYNVLVPQNMGTQICTSTVAAPVELNPDDADQKGILTALENASDYIFFKSSPAEGENAPKKLRYNAVSTVINADLSGQSRTNWYTAVENADINATRCVLLKTSYYLPFGLGAVNYNLKSLSYVEI